MKQTDGEGALELADVGAQRVARVYATAILNAAEKQQKAQAILDELEALVRDVFGRDPHFEAFLASAAIGRDRKAEAIRDAFDGKSDEVLVNFLLVLNQHDRLELLRPILAAYREIYNERGGRMRVQVRSAAPLPDDQQERLREELRQAFHKEPVLQAEVDPELIGGLVVQVGDWLYDASVRTRLEQLRNEILERSSHEIQSRRDRFRSDEGN
jgi:F-type H+-transporting ATPase subunit delta